MRCGIDIAVLNRSVSEFNEFEPRLKSHPELTRERSIRSLLFEIKRVFVYNSTVFKLTDLFI